MTSDRTSQVLIGEMSAVALASHSGLPDRSFVVEISDHLSEREFCISCVFQGFHLSLSRKWKFSKVLCTTYQDNFKVDVEP